MLKKWFFYIGLCIVFFTFVYGLWVFVAMQRTVNIAVDYKAKINEVAAAIPEDDRAWPLYREASVALRLDPEPNIHQIYDDPLFEEPTWPTHEGWSHYDSWIESHQETIAIIRKASKMVGSGLVLGSVAEEDREVFPNQYAEEQAGIETDDFLFSLMMPQLSHYRAMGRVLATDAKIAAHQGDATVCLEDIQAIFSMAKHVREHPVLISDLVSHSLMNLGIYTTSSILSNEPFLFDDESLEAIVRDLHSLKEVTDIRFDGERYLVLDLLQRMYTDDGNGDGSLIPIEASQSLMYLQGATNSYEDFSYMPALFAPIADIVHASRKELRDEYDSRLSVIESKKQYSLGELAAMKEPFPDYDDLGDSFIFNKNYLIDLLMPALDRVILQSMYTTGNIDGLLATIYAIESYQESGTWPISLEGANVRDSWTGESLLIATGERHPIIYSVGANLQDDAGMYNRHAHVFGSDKGGDWIFWPPQE